MPFGSAWLPQNQDPTNLNPQFNGTTTKPVNLYRPFPGYADANVLAFGGFSRYNSLQVGVNKRFSRGLLFGIAYTWSRATGVGSGGDDFVHPYDFRLANMGPLNYDVPHRLAVNWVYETPRLASGGNFLDNPVGRLIFNNWQISGIYEYQSGNPVNPSFSIDGVGNLNERYTGFVNIAPRMFINGNPHRTERTLQSQVDPSVFQLPVVGGATGWESGYNTLRLPSWYKVDASIFKNIPIWGEQRYFQLRVEMFNAFNNAQFNAMNSAMVFNQAGQIINLPTSLGGNGGRFGFGALTGTRDPRWMQLAAKFYF